MFTASPQSTKVIGTTFSSVPSSLAGEKKSKALYFLTAGIFLIALLSLAATGYAFYQRDLFQKKVDATKAELDKITYSQDGATLQDIEDLSGRLKGVVSIFTGAPSATSIFTIFESVAERGVSFGKIDITRTEGTRSYKVNLSGKANSFKDLILQRDTLRASPYSKYVTNVSVTSFTRDLESGQIVFVMTMNIAVGRFATGNLLVDLTKPSDTLVPKIVTPSPVSVDDNSSSPSGGVVSTTTIVQGGVSFGSSTLSTSTRSKPATP